MSTAIRTNIEQEKMGPFEPINGALRDHQSQATNWKFREPAEDLHLWAGRMVSEFKLQIGTPCLFIENLRRRRLGHFRPVPPWLSGVPDEHRHACAKDRVWPLRRLKPQLSEHVSWSSSFAFLVRELSSVNEKTCTGVRLDFKASVPNLFNGK